jgi:hypothetical protein
MSDILNDQIVVVKTNGHFVMNVNPRTRKATTNPQQFLASPNERGYSLEILPRARWVEHPVVVEVNSMRLG